MTGWSGAKGGEWGGCEVGEWKEVRGWAYETGEKGVGVDNMVMGGEGGGRGGRGRGGEMEVFFFKQKTAYEVGL